MVVKLEEYSNTELKNLSKQLQCPEGENGVFVAKKMSDNNIGMILSAMLQLRLNNNDVVLELGHGDGLHVRKIHTMASNLQYYGLDISPLMNELSQKNNKNLRRTSFNIYDGKEIIYKDALFDKIFTVNTIYFFNSLEQVLHETYRVLKPNGTFVLVFANKEFMKTLAFTKFGFTLYGLEELKKEISKTSFQITNCVTKSEFVKSKLDNLVERTYHVVELTK